jgi:hypothetical protein
MSTPFALPTLAPGATQTNTYLTELMARCAPLACIDVVQLLRAAYTERWALGFEQCAQFVERLPHFVETHLGPSVQARLNAPDGLLAAFERNIKRAERLPENFPFWWVGERQKLEERQQQLTKWAEQARREGHELDSARHLKDVAYIERVLIGLNAKEASGKPGNFYLDVTELNTWCPPTVTDAAVVVGPQQLLYVPAAIPIDFSQYIKEDYRVKLTPFLKEVYAGQKPQIVACMLVALQDLGALTTPLKHNVTELHAALEAFLGSVGTRQSLTDSLNKLDKASEKQNIKIQSQRSRIKSYMEQS